MSEKEEDAKKNGKVQPHNALEKVVFTAGLLIVASIFVYLGNLIIEERNQPPHLIVRTAYRPGMHNYSYEVKVINTGEETATNANIRLSLYQEGEVVESGTISINYVPVQGTETAWIVFHRRRQATDSLVVSSITYLKP